MALLAAASMAVAISSDEPYFRAAPDSRLVRKLLETPIGGDPRKVGYVAAALEMLGQDTAGDLHAYLERADWLSALGEPAPPSASVGEAIEWEKNAEPLDTVRARAFSKILTVELAGSGDAPEDVRADPKRWARVTASVWTRVGQNPDAETHFVHVHLRNSGRSAIEAFRATVTLAANPPILLECGASHPAQLPLEAGQRLATLCGSDWQKKVPLAAVAEAAKSVEAGRASLSVRPSYLVLQGAAFDLQMSDARFHYRPVRSPADPGERRKAAALVRESSCLARGDCLSAPLQALRPVLPFLVMCLVGGAITSVITGVRSGFYAVAKIVALLTAVAALVPVALFALVLTPGANWGTLAVAYFAFLGWVAFALGLWVSWLLGVMLLRRGTS
jgi:hypothetical protein